MFISRRNRPKRLPKRLIGWGRSHLPSFVWRWLNFLRTATATKTIVIACGHGCWEGSDDMKDKTKEQFVTKTANGLRYYVCRCSCNTTKRSVETTFYIIAENYLMAEIKALELVREQVSPDINPIIQAQSINFVE